MINTPNNIKLLGSLSVILSVFFCEGCDGKPPAHQVQPATPYGFSFSKSRDAKIAFPDSLIPIIRRINGFLVASAPTDNGCLQAVSNDNGISWSSPVLLNLCDRPLYPFSYRNRLLWYVSREEIPDGGQLYVHVPNNSGWNPPAQLRDTYWGQYEALQFAFDSLGTAYAVFVDYREGNRDIYFTRSLDTGKTWSPNVRINDDHTGQEQAEPTIAASPTGIVSILWADNRDSRTLFDIYCSSSSNRGQTWSSNTKVNDDTTHAWQISPSIIYNGNNFCAAWMDYRDLGASGDVRSNIYYAFSNDDAASWSRNIRISEGSMGNSTYPNLYVMGPQSLGCLWMDSGENILNDIFFSHSSNGGESWTSPTKGNDDSNLASHYHRGIGWLGADREGELFGWLDGRTGKSRARFATLVAVSDSLPARKTFPPATAKISPSAPLTYHTADELFTDRFESDSISRWQAVSGTWVRKDDAYIGYGAATNCAVVGDASWSDYEFSGRFKLDEFDHRAAYIYLRVTDNSPRHSYRITNFFRRGITLEYFDGGHSILLGDVPYSIRKDPWYRFRAVVKGNALNYYLNDTLLISSAKLVDLRRGKVGIGSERVPTYFKDITVRKVE